MTRVPSSMIFVCAAMTAILFMNDCNADEIENGIYSLAQGGDVFEDADGEQWSIERQYPARIHSASMKSSSNDNASYTLRIDCSFDEQPIDSVMVLIVDRTVLRFDGWSKAGVDDPVFWLSARVDGQEKIELFSKHFDVIPEPREHPGHQFMINCRSVEESYCIGDDVRIEFEITNAGDTEVRFMNGGQQRGARNNQYGFTAFSKGGVGPAVQDIGDPINFGGLAVRGLNKTGNPAGG